MQSEDPYKGLTCRESSIQGGVPSGTRIQVVHGCHQLIIKNSIFLILIIFRFGRKRILFVYKYFFIYYIYYCSLKINDSQLDTRIHQERTRVPSLLQIV